MVLQIFMNGRLISYLARANYNYNSKYYLTPLYVLMDHPGLVEKKIWRFPFCCCAWRISDENFLKNVSFLNDLKIRASYGETGNNNIGNYDQFCHHHMKNITGGAPSVVMRLADLPIQF